MKLAIVGHGEDKFTEITEMAAHIVILDHICRISPSVIISGHSPMGGIDIWAEEAAEFLDIEKDIRSPDVFQWNPGGKLRGYMCRNIEIVDRCDALLNIVVSEYPPNYNGMRFDECYHCNKQIGIPRHIKSGGCWTMWAARHKTIWMAIIDPDGTYTLYDANTRSIVSRRDIPIIIRS